MCIRLNLNFRINYFTESRKPCDIQISIWLPYPLHQCWFYYFRSNHLTQYLLKTYWGTKGVKREREREINQLFEIFNKKWKRLRKWYTKVSLSIKMLWKISLFGWRYKNWPSFLSLVHLRKSHINVPANICRG